MACREPKETVWRVRNLLHVYVMYSVTLAIDFNLYCTAGFCIPHKFCIIIVMYYSGVLLYIDLWLDRTVKRL